MNNIEKYSHIRSIEVMLKKNNEEKIYSLHLIWSITGLMKNAEISLIE